MEFLLFLQVLLSKHYVLEKNDVFVLIATLPACASLLAGNNFRLGLSPHPLIFCVSRSGHIQSGPVVG